MGGRAPGAPPLDPPMESMTVFVKCDKSAKFFLFKIEPNSNLSNVQLHYNLPVGSNEL